MQSSKIQHLEIIAELKVIHEADDDIS